MREEPPHGLLQHKTLGTWHDQPRSGVDWDAAPANPAPAAGRLASEALGSSGVLGVDPDTAASAEHIGQRLYAKRQEAFDKYNRELLGQAYQYTRQLTSLRAAYQNEQTIQTM